MPISQIAKDYGIERRPLPMISVKVNLKTGEQTITDLGPDPRDDKWIPEFARVFGENVREKA